MERGVTVQEVGLGQSGIELSKKVVYLWERLGEPMSSYVVYQIWVG